MTAKLQVHVGESLDDIGARAVSAWHRMERGEEVQEKHISFETWETMVRVLSPKRLELLRGTFTGTRRKTSAPCLLRSAETIAGCMRTWRPWRRQGYSIATRKGCGRSMIPSMWL